MNKQLLFLFLFFCSLSAAVAQGTITVKGVVTDAATKESIPGVSVRIKGQNTGMATSLDGSFTIQAPSGATLTFVSIGYTTQEVAVNDRTTINVALAPSTSTLDQVVVVGYGQQRKLDVTGAVGTIKGEEISKQASQNVVSSLQGKIAGVQITNSGSPGASPTIRIRGLGTIFGNAQVLYVVDGVWYDDISFLNPNDVETMSVLKDASAQSIYGLRAANGVVLVTTKKGKSGKQTINVDAFAGFQSVTNEVEMANATEYATIVNELTVSNGGTAPYANPASFGEGTNWNHQVLRNAFINSSNVSISGGSENSNYTMSLGYLKQDGLVKDNSFNRITARFQNEFTVNKALKFGYNITGAATKSKDINGGIFHQIYSASPLVPVYYADGTYGDPNDFNVGSAVQFNPQVTLDFFNQNSRGYRGTGNIFGEVKFLDHFTFRTSAGGEFGQAEVRGYSPVYAATLSQRNTVSQLNLTRDNTRNWIVENTLTYGNEFGDHNLTLLLGQSAQRNRFFGLTGSARNVPNNSEGDLYITLGSNDTANPRQVNDYGSLTTFSSYFTRANYSFQDKYLLNASLRVDGASQFYNGGDLYAYLPSVGAGWVISNESFMKNQELFSNLKLRGSWGKIGNAIVPINPTTRTITTNAGLTAIYGPSNGNITGTGAADNTVVPPFLNWEKGNGLNFGLEAGMLSGRLNFELDWYRRTTEQAIFRIPIRGDTGFAGSDILGNQADIRNQGFEALVSYTNGTNQAFNYSVSANIGVNDNKVVSVVTGENPIYAGGNGITGGALATRTVLGQPIGQFYGYQVAGIFQSAAEIAASPQTAAKPGDFRFVDRNSDGAINDKDKAVLGNPNAKYSYGINTNFRYKSFDLAVDGQGVADVDIYNSNLGFRFGNENFSKEFFNNRWRGAGSSNAYPSANIGGGTNYLPNAFFVESGSYFRIRNIQLGYTLPGASVSKLKLSRVRIYANAQNAFNFFSYRGFSPEVGGGPTNAGLDANVYPLYATYNFGLNVTF